MYSTSNLYLYIYCIKKFVIDCVIKEGGQFTPHRQVLALPYPNTGPIQFKMLNLSHPHISTWPQHPSTATAVCQIPVNRYFGYTNAINYCSGLDIQILIQLERTLIEVWWREMIEWAHPPPPTWSNYRCMIEINVTTVGHYAVSQLQG